MPRYFFHVRDGNELSDERVAKDQAIVLAGELLRELDGEFWKMSTGCLEVLDENGTEVCRLILSPTSRD